MTGLAELREEFLFGNTDRLKEIYQDYYDDVLHIVLSKDICSLSEAENAFSESLLIFYENVISKKLTEVKSLKNYLAGICINVIRNELYVKFRHQKKVNEVRLLLYDNGYHKPDTNIKEKLTEICSDAMHQLSEKCRQIIESYYLDRLSMKEVARKLDLASADVAKTLKSRCLKSLSNIVRDRYNDVVNRI